jgi:hypothetical protein
MSASQRIVLSDQAPGRSRRPRAHGHPTSASSTTRNATPGSVGYDHFSARYALLQQGVLPVRSGLP